MWIAGNSYIFLIVVIIIIISLVSKGSKSTTSESRYANPRIKHTDSENQNVKFCPNCGARNNKAANYCQNCGKDIFFI